MITVDFSWAVAFYIFILVNGLLLAWAALRKREKRDIPREDRFLWFCTICAYTYINSKDEVISLCPRCGSFNKKTIDNNL